MAKFAVIYFSSIRISVPRARMAIAVIRVIDFTPILKSAI